MNSELQSHISQIRVSALKNNFKSDVLLRLTEDCISQKADKEFLHHLLDIAHLSNVSRHIHKTKQIDLWFSYIVEIIKLSSFNVGYLLKQRGKGIKTKLHSILSKKGSLTMCPMIHYGKKL